MSGCQPAQAVPAGATVPVKGVLRYQGKPLTSGAVTFEPTDIGREAHGEVRPDGTFELTTFRPGDGAVAGTHRVAVDGAKGLPARFRRPSSSGVEVNVACSRCSENQKTRSCPPPQLEVGTCAAA